MKVGVCYNYYTGLINNAPTQYVCMLFNVISNLKITSSARAYSYIYSIIIITYTNELCANNPYLRQLSLAKRGDKHSHTHNVRTHQPTNHNNNDHVLHIKWPVLCVSRAPRDHHKMNFTAPFSREMRHLSFKFLSLSYGA